MNQEELSKRIKETERIIAGYLPKEEGFIKSVAKAMNYSFLAGGKRLRPLLMQETFFLFGGTGKLVEPFMAALEMIHTYSLIHDDLPCMDNDEYRRGQKTTHIVYGEGMAVLAGDALLNYAYETAAGAFGLLDEDDLQGYARVAGALRILAEKAGIYGMVGGQAVDVEAEKKGLPVNAEMLLFIHQNKTAALVEAAMMTGALLAGASGEQITQMEQCARDVGIAFQIQDDILDVAGSQEEMGKPVGSDEKNHKETYVSIFGMEKSQEDVNLLSARAAELVQRYETADSGTFLRELILSLINRTH